MSSSAAPLLSPRQSPPRTSALSLLLSRVASTSQRRGGPSVMVRETAARELEERRADWGYSRPVVAVDILWNLAFVIVTVVMLICTADEKPDVPIRVWVCGYVFQCLVHVVLVWVEYNRRSSRQERIRADPLSIEDQTQSDSDEDYANRGGLFWFCGYNGTSVVKRWESLNTVVSFIWWIVGFYWVVSGGETLLSNAPRLYWLAVVFLSFDVIFAILCVVLALLIGIALCCCLPCIIAILYAIAGQEGASESDLSVLPKYRYEVFKDHRVNIAAGTMIPIETSSGCRGNIQNLAPEDTECCICLCTYEDGTELHSLSCEHHFHTTCIVKWLKMNATCPLCKYNILKGGNQV